MGFRKLTIATLAAVYILILVGGVVRSTGSGMGCPDWPKCFGSWVPPKSVEELPSNYKDIYAEYRAKKNLRFAKYLTAFGMADTADKLLSDKTVLQEADFNATKTWIEYVNRVVGVIIGFLIFAVCVVAMRYWKSDKTVPLIAISAFILVSFTGWIGSFVVSTNLTPWTVTVHMFLALAIVALLIYLVYYTEQTDNTQPSAANAWLTAACIISVLIQIFLGTNVREAIDSISQQTPRYSWIATIENTFIIHRTFSWIVLVLHVWLCWKLTKSQGLKPFLLPLILLILGSILSGIVMGYFGVPAIMQPLHLVLATGTFGLLFMLLLKFSRGRKLVTRVV
jgi:heme a synthase